MRSTQLRKIQKGGYKFHYNGMTIKEIEVCGVVINLNPSHIVLYDFYGIIPVCKNRETTVPDGTNTLVLRPFARSSSNKVEFFCKGSEKIGLYGEMVFNLEVAALFESRFYLE